MSSLRGPRPSRRLATLAAVHALALAIAVPAATAATRNTTTSNARPACPATATSKSHTSDSTVGVRNGRAANGVRGWTTKTARGHIRISHAHTRGPFPWHSAVAINRHGRHAGWGAARDSLRRSRPFELSSGSYRLSAWVRNTHSTRSVVRLALGRGFRHYEGHHKLRRYVVRGRRWHYVSTTVVASRPSSHAAVYVVLPHRRHVRLAVTGVSIRPMHATCPSTGSGGTTTPVAGSPTPAPGAPSPTPSPTTTATSASDPSGQPMPTGDLAGWHQVLAEDFLTPTTTFPGPYGATWMGYNNIRDTSKAGLWTDSAISVHDGMLDMHLQTVDGVPQVAAPIPLVNGQWGEITYGRYTVRFRADDMPGYKSAFLLWPDSDNWSDGEVDFPEGGFDGTLSGYDHHVGSPMKFDAAPTSTGYQGWHTATIEWLPTGVTFSLDGVQVGHSSVSPSVPMHWVLQTETNGGAPAASVSGHVDVDWAAIYTRS